MNLLDLQNKTIAILGLGQEGLAVLDYLLKYKIKPVIYDQKLLSDFPKNTKEKLISLNLNLVLGQDSLKELNGIDIAFRSPGIWRKNPDLVSAGKNGLIITSQTKFFFDNCQAKIIGVTGTKGKGTTSSIIYNILSANSRFPSASWRTNPQLLHNHAQLGQFDQIKKQNVKPQIYLTGNIGMVQPFEILDQITQNDYVVFELSSFQLQDLEKSPHLAVVLMTTSEHLDVHKNSQEYLRAKSSITKYQNCQDFAIINADFENSLKIGEQGSGKKIYISRVKELVEGCYVNNNNIVFKNEKENSQFPISNFQLRGKHNLENICAAIAVCKCLNCVDEIILKTIINFKGLEHRLEFITEKNGIKFYNDSFSTTPETAIAAVKSFSENLILILGGSAKNSDFTELAETIAVMKNIKKIILVGQEAIRLKSALTKVSFSQDKILEGAQTMPEIFNLIKVHAAPGDVVLLSPACASFGTFKNYKDRGEQFKNLAAKFNF